MCCCDRFSAWSSNNSGIVISYLYSIPAIGYPACAQALTHISMVIPLSFLMLLIRILPCALSTQQPLYTQPAGREIFAEEVAEEVAALVVDTVELADILPDVVALLVVELGCVEEEEE